MTDVTVMTMFKFHSELIYDIAYYEQDVFHYLSHKTKKKKYLKITFMFNIKYDLSEQTLRELLRDEFNIKPHNIIIKQSILKIQVKDKNEADSIFTQIKLKYR